MTARMKAIKIKLPKQVYSTNFVLKLLGRVRTAHQKNNLMTEIYEFKIVFHPTRRNHT